MELNRNIKTETVALGLIRGHQLRGGLLLRPLGSFRRRFSGEVERIENTEIGTFKGTVISLNRSGLYDYLPESLFHLRLEAIQSVDKKIEDIRRQRKREQYARLFFLPFDQEFALQRIAVENMETGCSLLDSDTRYVKNIREFWGVPPIISDAMFEAVLPWLSRLRESDLNPRFAETVLTSVCGYQVKVVVQTEEPTALKSGFSLAGKTSLGLDSVLPGILPGMLPSFEIAVFIKNGTCWRHFKPGTALPVLINWLVDRLFPVGFEVAWKVLMPLELRGFVLEENNESSGRLSYSTFLPDSLPEPV